MIPGFYVKGGKYQGFLRASKQEQHLAYVNKSSNYGYNTAYIKFSPTANGGYLNPKEILPMYHTIIIVGNVGKDPEMRYTPSGQAVTSFSVATNRQYTTGNGEQVKETIWFRVTTWGKQAEICNQYVKKGSKVLIEGRLTPDKATGGPRIWTKQDGSAGASFEVTAGTVRFLSSRGEGGEGAPTMGGGFEGAEIPAEDDIPF
jgi:single-strand DNA-binding protein